MQKFMSYYSRAPFFMQVTANSAEELAAKVAAIDAKLNALKAPRNE